MVGKEVPRRKGAPRSKRKFLKRLGVLAASVEELGNIKVENMNKKRAKVGVGMYIYAPGWGSVQTVRVYTVLYG